ncbi:ATP-binding cassette domain-containing protein [Arcanobacterium phocae]|uniref:ATP-binding cassette domain-containing protein n=2 Tax=Arcanobacterium phocae TaxID=131112 RepID=UPI001C11D172|nr:ABC transporter ATP-binding protein [Arcanobacterium phocae]
MDQKINPLRDAIQSSWWATRDAFRVFPALTAGAWFACLVMMAIPSLQVWSVRWAGGQLTLDSHRSRLFICLVIAASATLLGLASSLSSSINRILQMDLRAHYGAKFSATVDHLTPAQTLDNSFMSKVRATREATPFNVAWQATSTITVVSSIIAMILLGASLWSINPWAAILIIAALLPDLLLYSKLAHVENDVWQEAGPVTRRIDYLEQLQDFTPSSTEMAANPGSFGIPAELNSQHGQYAKLWNRVPQASIRLSFVANIAVFALMFSALFIVLRSDSTVNDVVAAMLGMLSGLSVTRSVGSAFGEFMASVPLIKAYKELIELLTKPRAGEVIAGPVGIEVSHGSFTYPTSTGQTLSDINLNIEPGSVVAFLGENGCGKTTLVKLLAGLLEPDSGTITMRGSNTESSAACDRLASTSMVFQDFTKLELTVRDFVDPAAKESDAAIRDALTRARAWEFIQQLPAGIDSQLGPQWDGSGLSGGQWQRLALARTFLSGAPVWILDEPTAAVDAQAEAAIYEDVLRQRPAGTTVIIITHRPQTLTDVDAIIYLENGHIINTVS